MALIIKQIEKQIIQVTLPTGGNYSILKSDRNDSGMFSVVCTNSEGVEIGFFSGVTSYIDSEKGITAEIIV